MAEEMTKSANSEVTQELITEFRDAFDCNLYFFDKAVDVPVMYAIICVTIVVLVGVFVLLNVLKAKGVSFKMPAKAKKEKKNA